MSIFRKKILRKNRFSKVVHFIILLVMVFNTSALGVLLSPISVKALYITPNVPPTAEANGPYAETIGNAINFSMAGSMDSDGTIVLYEWDFDYDGIIFATDSFSVNPSYTYASAGSYTVGLRVMDDKGVFSIIDMASVVINALPLLDPTFSFQETVDKAAVSSGGSARYSIRASNSGPDAAIGVSVTDIISPNFDITGVSCAGANGATCIIGSSVSPVVITGDLPTNSFFDVFIDLAVAPAASEGLVSNYASLTFGITTFQGSPVNVIIDKTASAMPNTAPAGGDYSAAQTVTLSSSDALSGLKEIRYTTDGSVPTVSSALYSTPMLISQNTTLKAIAIDNAGNISETMTAVYGIAAQISGQSISETSSELVIIKWTTDKPATSRVVYDTIPHTVIGSAPNYGYANSTQEQDIAAKVSNHAVSLAGLVPGTTYYYRTISKASPEAVSAESSFNTAPNIAPVANSHGPYEAILKDGKAEVSLVGTGTDTDGSIVKYEWDFEGDGIFDLAILPSAAIADGSISHIYAKEGTYKPALRVTDNRGAIGTDTTKAVISAHGTAAAFSAGPGDLTVAADGQLALFSTAVDSFGNSWSAAADTAFSVDDPCGKIVSADYYPCQAGEWEIQAEYQSLKAKMKVKVVTGDLDRLEISPYAKPFKIQENKSQVFAINGFDADGNEVAVLDPEWSTVGEKVAIGKIDKNGKFLATHGGIGRITAEVGKLTVSVGVIVKEMKVAAPIKKKANVAKASTDQAAISDQAEETAESAPIEEEQLVSSEETKPAEDGTVAGEENQACTTLPWGVWYGLAAFYAIFLIIYYMNLRKLDKEHGLARNWWAIPLLLTGVMIGVYFLYRCPGVFLRWPWALILIGVIISAVYYQSREPEDLPPAGSITGGDDNVKTI